MHACASVLYLVDDVLTLLISKELLEEERTWLPGELDHFADPFVLQHQA